VARSLGSLRAEPLLVSRSDDKFGVEGNRCGRPGERAREIRLGLTVALRRYTIGAPGIKLPDLENAGPETVRSSLGLLFQAFSERLPTTSARISRADSVIHRYARFIVAPPRLGNPINPALCRPSGFRIPRNLSSRFNPRNCNSRIRFADPRGLYFRPEGRGALSSTLLPLFVRFFASLVRAKKRACYHVRFANRVRLTT